MFACPNRTYRKVFKNGQVAFYFSSFFLKKYREKNKRSNAYDRSVSAPLMTERTKMKLLLF